MSFLIDTNVISEITRPNPDPRVVSFLHETDEDRSLSASSPWVNCAEAWRSRRTDARNPRSTPGFAWTCAKNSPAGSSMSPRRSPTCGGIDGDG